jgi:hypothetical protein
MMGAPSKLSVIRKAAALGRARPTLLLSWAEKAGLGSGRIHDLIALTKLLKLQKSDTNWRTLTGSQGGEKLTKDKEQHTLSQPLTDQVRTPIDVPQACLLTFGAYLIKTGRIECFGSADSS